MSSAILTAEITGGEYYIETSVEGVDPRAVAIGLALAEILTKRLSNVLRKSDPPLEPYEGTMVIVATGGTDATTDGEL